ncbi:hypothetical protein Y1Q_0020600 [Alligator mississippiensis]|uniref:Uncharacterized protein n=1 Tax=Alligator mississippiensis TaxID=8496 RepID=A0A151NPW6_ALLMI|nr:hypothetical protein Y1Q_0020600 [Alligator mississippiensis]
MLWWEKLPPVRLRSSNLAPDACLGADGWAKRILPPIKGSSCVPSVGQVQERRDPAPGATPGQDSDEHTNRGSPLSKRTGAQGEAETPLPGG